MKLTCRRGVWRKATWFARRFFMKLFRTIAYMPHVWRNEDFDFQYLNDITEYKVRRMRKSMAEHTEFVSENRDQYVAEMDECLRLFRESRDSNYPLNPNDTDPAEPYKYIAKNLHKWWW